MMAFKTAPFDDTDGIADLGKLILTGANISEDATYAEWSNVTAYTIGQIVKLAAQHKLYEAITNNTNKNPVTFLNTDWIEIGATNLWKCMDQSLQSYTVADVDDILLEYQMNTLVTTVALFGLSGTLARVRVFDPASGGTEFYNQEVELIDYSVLIDWFEYFFAETVVQTEAVFTGLPGYTGLTLSVEVEGASAPAQIAEITAGRAQSIGNTTTGGRIGEIDFSTVNEDTFGNISIVRRGAARLVEFPVSWPSSDTRRVLNVLEEIRDFPSVFFSDEGEEAFGMFVYGYYQTFDINLVSRYATFATIEVRSLT